MARVTKILPFSIQNAGLVARVDVNESWLVGVVGSVRLECWEW